MYLVLIDDELLLSSNMKKRKRLLMLSNPTNGQIIHGIYKQQLIESFIIHPSLAGISIATINKGQKIQRHIHQTMHEFFYILSGTIIIEYTTPTNINHNDNNKSTASAVMTTTTSSSLPKIEIDARHYLVNSDHRLLWNEAISKIEQQQQSVSLTSTIMDN